MPELSLTNLYNSSLMDLTALNTKIFYSIALVFFVCGQQHTFAETDKTNYQKVLFETKDGATIEGAFFTGKGPRAIVFAHGAVFSKESWYSLAGQLKKQGIASIAINFRGYGQSKPGKSNALYYDVLGAVTFLAGKRFEHIALVGGSMGATAVLHALSHTANPKIDKVVLLAPAGGEPIAGQKVKKLFITAEQDRFYPKVYDLYQASSKPKELKVFPGTAHGQHLFKTTYGAIVIKEIIGFLEDH